MDDSHCHTIKISLEPSAQMSLKARIRNFSTIRFQTLPIHAISTLFITKILGCHLKSSAVVHINIVKLLFTPAYFH